MNVSCQPRCEYRPKKPVCLSLNHFRDSVEHITPEILPDFASMLLGVYQPRLFLITTPSYTFNARFTPPNAPPSARSGYPDPTKRTDRIFRHHDHKFEWTVDEFQEYCRGVADEWGYEVETSGVGTAQEVDEWGRDEDLGFASQVAIFRRREEDQYSCTRTKKSQEYIEKVKGRKVHQLLAAHQHAAHPDAKRPVSLEEIGEQVRKIMEEFQEAIMTLRELWFMREISTACGGQVELLGEAIERHNDLKCRRTNDGIWEVHWLGYKPEFKSVPIDDEKSRATNTVWRDDASTRPESKGWDWEENEADIQTDWGASWGSSSTEVDGWGDTQVVEVART